MFKTVLQQHSFQEIVKFLNAFDTAQHHTKSKDKYVARIVCPWKHVITASDSKWNCHCNTRL